MQSREPLRVKKANVLCCIQSHELWVKTTYPCDPVYTSKVGVAAFCFKVSGSHNTIKAQKTISKNILSIFQELQHSFT